MKTKLLLLVLALFMANTYAQEFVKGSIITTHYDTIANVQIKKMNDAKSTLHLTYIDKEGLEQKPVISTIKCYTRGEEIFCRVYQAGEMIMVKQVEKGKKINLYKRVSNGIDIYYVEKVYDEIIKVPVSKNKFKNVLSDYLSSVPEISAKIKSKELSDIHEIIKLYNES